MTREELEIEESSNQTHFEKKNIVIFAMIFLCICVFGLIALVLIIPDCHSPLRTCTASNGTVWFSSIWKKTLEKSIIYCEKHGASLADIPLAKEILYPNWRKNKNSYWISDTNYSRNIEQINQRVIPEKSFFNHFYPDLIEATDAMAYDSRRECIMFLKDDQLAMYKCVPHVKFSDVPLWQMLTPTI